MPKVSVIIPVYNTEPYLRRCLDSVCNQTLSDIEIICVNDASPDNSAAILHEYAQKDSRVKVIEFAENKGVSVARNTGMDAARGEYIGFVDSDDYVDLDFYEKLYQCADGADCAKGTLKEIDENTGTDISSDLYNLNDKIRINKAYFYCSFSSAIYKKSCLIFHSIKFPVGIRHFEDPYFSIRFSVYADRVCLSEGACYYYVRRRASVTLSRVNKDGISDIMASICMITDMLNKECEDEECYIIVYHFLFSIVVNWCFALNVCNNSIEIAVNCFDYIYKNSKFGSIALYRYFAEHKRISETRLEKERLERQEKLRIKLKLEMEKIHADCNLLIKSYSRDNKLSDGRTMMKILVGYVKPSFLFKTDILVPMHLGRAVAREESILGKVNALEIRWLQENTIGDDDFEGNISSINRRVGFLTGTYWAYKNYHLLGNPEYFGFFGYRRLLKPDFICQLMNVDLVLPELTVFPKSIYEQYVDMHGNIFFRKAMCIIGNIYPEEIEGIENFFAGNCGYLCEIYVLRKKYFFAFCEWIFPVLFNLLKIPRDFYCASNDCLRTIDNFSMNRQGDGLKHNRYSLYQNRDIGFFVERLTGYFFMKLTQSNDVKFIEVPVVSFNMPDKSHLSIRQYEILNKIRNDICYVGEY